MKKYLLMGLLFCNKSLIAQIDPTYDSMTALNLNYYTSKPVDSFLKVISQSYNYIKIYGVLTKNKARGLSIFYPSGMNIIIIPKHFIYMNPIDSTRTWDLTLFKKETASYITIIHAEYAPLTGQYP